MRKAALLGTIWAVANLACAAQPADPGQAGPHPVGERTVTVTRPDTSTFSAYVFYPAQSAGADAAVDRSGAPYPALAFGHGFLSPPLLYRYTLRHLASWGYVVIAPASALELFPDHQAFADDLRYSLYLLAASSSTSGHPFAGAVDPDRWGLSGHSMGGGAAILAAADEPRVGAVASLAPAETKPSAIAAVANVRAPVCFVAGQRDAIAPLRRHAQPLYDRAKAPKLLPVIQGGSHCGFVDVPLPDAVCDEADLPHDVQLRTARRMLTAFFNLYLKDDLSAWTYVWGPARALDPLLRTSADPGFTLRPYYQRLRAPAGATVTARLTVTNTDNVPATFRIGTEGAPVGLAIHPDLTAPLAPGASAVITVTVPRPARPARLVPLVVIEPTNAPGTRAFALIDISR